MDIDANSQYLMFHVIDDVEGETHLVVDLALALRALDTMSMSFVNMLDGMPGAFVSKYAELRVALEPEAALLLDDYAIGEAIDDWEEEHGGPPIIVNALSARQFCAESPVAVVSGEDLRTLLGKNAFDEWPDPYRVHLVFRPDETGHSVYMIPEIVVSDSWGRHFAFYGNSGYQKWSDIRALMPMTQRSAA